jgi:hypothetical protein
MRLRLFFHQGDQGGPRVEGDLWDEDGVIHSFPTSLVERLNMVVIGWPEHPEPLTVADGVLWLLGMLWKSEMGQLGGRSWLTVIEP